MTLITPTLAFCFCLYDRVPLITGSNSYSLNDGGMNLNFNDGDNYKLSLPHFRMDLHHADVYSLFGNTLKLIGLISLPLSFVIYVPSDYVSLTIMTNLTNLSMLMNNLNHSFRFVSNHNLYWYTQISFLVCVCVCLFVCCFPLV